jgi:hypothetical protein
MEGLCCLDWLNDTFKKHTTLYEATGLEPKLMGVVDVC